MSEEKREEIVEQSEETRREFVKKLVVAAGAVAAAGLVAGAEKPAEGATLVKGEGAFVKLDKHGQSEWKLVKWKNGFRVTISNHEIGVALQSFGLLDQRADLDKAQIAIEFTAG